MSYLKILNQDFMYSDPEIIFFLTCQPGPEDEWFIKKPASCAQFLELKEEVQHENEK